MPQSSSRPDADVFSPRRRLPLDPFAADAGQGLVRETWKRMYWEVDLERSGVHRSRVLQRVILVLGGTGLLLFSYSNLSLRCLAR